MSKRITDEQKILINELYAQCKVKKRVAEALGISPASVSRYIVEGYTPKKDRKPIPFDKVPTGADAMIKRIKESGLTPAKAFAVDCELSLEEWEDMKELQKEVLL